MTEQQRRVVEDVQWHEVAAGRVRTVRHRPVGPRAVRHVLVLPGLALPAYLFPFARELAGRGIDTTVFDALAFRGGRRVGASVGALASAAAEWVGGSDPAGPVVVVGHSTGAQVAAEVALHPSTAGRVQALVLAGPTFVPDQRSWPRLARATGTAYRRDTPREVAAVRHDLLRVRGDVVRVIRSGLGHHLEDRLPQLTMPLTLTAGVADSFAPAGWLERLASCTGGPARIAVLPGSHNTVYPYAARFADVVEGAVHAVG